MAGCDKPPDLRTTTRAYADAGPTDPDPDRGPERAPASVPDAPADHHGRALSDRVPRATAVNCGGRPGGREVLAVLRRAGLVTRSSGARVVTGPLCAGTWQCTVVQMPNADPLQVVTRARPARCSW